MQSPEEGEENDGTEEFDGSPEQKLSAQSRSSQRYPKDAQSKRPKLTSETPEERQKRLDHKREINRRCHKPNIQIDRSIPLIILPLQIL